MEDCKNYLQTLIAKYSFINEIFLTDNEGSSIASIKQGEETEESIKTSKELKTALSYSLNTTLEQIGKTEKWSTNSITTIFGKYTVFQSKINKITFGHFICDSEKYSHEILKEIVIDLQKRLEKVEKELEIAKKEMDK